MATAAFKSTTKRTPMGSSSSTGDAGSSSRANTHRRSRSLSGFSGRFLPSDPDDDGPQRSGRFVNTVRGSGFPEISLDDLANEFFLAKGSEESENSRGRSGRRFSTSGPTVETNQRRGRSVSRNYVKGKLENNLGRKDIPDSISSGRRSVSFMRNSGNLEKNSGGKDILDSGSERKRSVSVVQNSRNLEKNSGGKEVLDSNSRRRRSFSVARDRFSDSESDMDHSHNSSNHEWKSFSNRHFQNPSLHKPTAHNHQRALRRSLSQKHLQQVHDGYSSYSSALTDDEAQDAHSQKNGFEKIIRAVYAQKKSEHPTGDGGENGLFEAMRTEVRHAFEQIRTDLEQVMVKTTPSVLGNTDSLELKGSDALQAISEIRRNYTPKLEESEKQKTDLLAKSAVEEQRGHEISKIVRQLLPEPKQTAPPDKPSRARKKSNDRSRMSKRLTEEAEKYFEDFISNVEDTDISSFDGEKSDASSTFGGSSKSRDPTLQCMGTEIVGNTARAVSLPVEMDGVVLPWLLWETSNENSPLPCKNKMESLVALQNNVLSTAQEADAGQSSSNFFESSRGSWSPDSSASLSAVSINEASSRFMESENYSSLSPVGMVGASSFNMETYLSNQISEDVLFERFRNRNRINSGGLVLCTTSSF